MRKNVKRLNLGLQGEPHERNLQRWKSLLSSSDVPGLRRVLTGLDRDSIEMREVSPLGGLLSNEDRDEILRRVN